jgi:hypothetical protein
MKKVLYMIALVTVLATSFVACTDENVKPQTNEGGGMGSGIDPKGH